MGNFCNSEENEYEQDSLVNRCNQNINTLFAVAKEFVQEENYEEALKRFLIVKKLDANFTKIDFWVKGMTLMVAVSIIYNEGVQLYYDMQCREALIRFVYIEEELFENFKECRQYIANCHETIWVVQLTQEVRDKYNDIEALKYIEEGFYVLRSAYAKRRQLKNVKQQENNDDDNGDGDDDDERASDQQITHKKLKKSIIEKSNRREKLYPSFKNKKLEKLPVYYECVKKPVCKSNGQNPFKHAACGTQAFINVDCNICCSSNCQPFYIGEALFSCSQRQVLQRSANINANTYECIDSQMAYSEFLNDCLARDQHSQIMQSDFIFASSPGMMQLLIKYQS